MESTTIEVSSDLIETLTSKAALLAESHEARQAAIAEENKAEALVLDRVLAAVKPALRAMSGRICTRDFSTGGRNGLNPVSSKDYAAEKGVLLINGYDREKDCTGNRGSYGGKCLWLLSDGRFAETKRQGHWSCWQGESEEWEATLTIKTPLKIAEDYKLDAVIDAISKKVDSHLNGKSEDTTKKAKERAEKLRAIAALTAGYK